MIGRAKKLFLLSLTGLALAPHSVFACAACFGKSDSPMAKGMNWGIFSLLVVVVSVLGSIAAVSFVLARRAAAVSQAPAPVPAANVHPKSGSESPVSTVQPSASRTP
jgi:protein-disulfide isomerase